MDLCPYLESGLLAHAGFTHAFFTRHGGGVPEAAHTLGLAPERLYVAAQLHDRGVILLHGSEDPAAVARTAADAIVSSALGIGCAVRTADCVPILLADPESGRVAAVHAGWRGLVRGVIASATERMAELGSRRAALLAAFGPHIGPEAFEVGDDVAREIERASLARDVVQRASNGKALVDLARVVRAQLRGAGLAEERIEQVPGCTYRDASRFFSYRRDGQRSGRLLTVIVARGPAAANAAQGHT